MNPGDVSASLTCRPKFGRASQQLAMATVSKTDEPHGLVGSTPTPSAIVGVRPGCASAWTVNVVTQHVTPTEVAGVELTPTMWRGLRDLLVLPPDLSDTHDGVAE